MKKREKRLLRALARGRARIAAGDVPPASCKTGAELLSWLKARCRLVPLTSERALMERLLEMLRRQGVRMAYSCITLPNPASTGLHAAMGFTEAGVLTDAGWKNGQWRDVVWMQKRLNENADAPREVVPIGNIDVRDLLGSDE